MAEAGVPNISQVVPLMVSAGSNGVTVEIVGTNFSDKSVVMWNGNKLSTTLVNGTTLSSPVESANLAVPGTADLQVQNSLTGQHSKSVSVTIASPAVTTRPLAIATTSLAQGVIGVPYNASLVATGGTPTYTWKISSGRLPSGVTLAPTGVLSGTPTSIGDFSFTVSASDSGNPVQTKSSSMTLVVAASPLTITTSSLSSVAIGKAYSQTLQGSGGTPAYRWSITSGKLPSGLSLSAAKGTPISGTPTAEWHILHLLQR